MSECRGANCAHPDCDRNRQPANIADLERQIAATLADTVVKYDGNGQPVRLGEYLAQLPNRAARREALRDIRREAKRGRRTP